MKLNVLKNAFLYIFQNFKYILELIGWDTYRFRDILSQFKKKGKL